MQSLTLELLFGWRKRMKKVWYTKWNCKITAFDDIKRQQKTSMTAYSGR